MQLATLTLSKFDAYFLILSCLVIWPSSFKRCFSLVIEGYSYTTLTKPAAIFSSDLHRKTPRITILEQNIHDSLLQRTSVASEYISSDKHPLAGLHERTYAKVAQVQSSAVFENVPLRLEIICDGIWHAPLLTSCMLLPGDFWGGANWEKRKACGQKISWIKEVELRALNWQYQPHYSQWAA